LLNEDFGIFWILWFLNWRKKEHTFIWNFVVKSLTTNRPKITLNEITISGFFLVTSNRERTESCCLWCFKVLFGFFQFCGTKKNLSEQFLIEVVKNLVWNPFRWRLKKSLMDLILSFHPFLRQRVNLTLKVSTYVSFILLIFLQVFSEEHLSRFFCKLFKQFMQS
jgi:hypothetical protein